VLYVKDMCILSSNTELKYHKVIKDFKEYRKFLLEKNIDKYKYLYLKKQNDKTIK